MGKSWKKRWLAAKTAPKPVVEKAVVAEPVAVEEVEPVVEKAPAKKAVRTKKSMKVASDVSKAD